MFDIKAPSAKDIVVIGGVAFIIFIGMRISSNYQHLVKDNAILSEQTAQLSSKNDTLVKSVDNLTNQVKSMNDIVATETRRRAAAEMKQQRLQDEIKEALKKSPCGAVVLPDDIIDRLREKADSVRSGKSEATTDTSQPAK